MKVKSNFPKGLLIIVMLAMTFKLTPGTVYAHCDTLDGPVISDAKVALEKGDVTPVLKWVNRKYEAEIRSAFNKTLAVRAKGAEAKELADMYFFETLVRIHRAGEGAPYTGLKPAGAVEPVVTLADKAIEAGKVDDLAGKISGLVSQGIRERFNQLMEKKKYMNKSVEAGREYVEAYVSFVHYLERLHNEAEGKITHHGEPEEETTSHQGR